MPPDSQGATNADLVREAVAAWNANDWAAIESLNHPDVLVEAPKGWPEAEDAVGWEATRRQYERIKESFAEERIEPTSIRELDGGRVLLDAQWIARGEASGAEVHLAVAVLYTYVDGLISHTSFFLSLDDARRAAGLETEPS